MDNCSSSEKIENTFNIRILSSTESDLVKKKKEFMNQDVTILVTYHVTAFAEVDNMNFMVSDNLLR